MKPFWRLLLLIVGILHADWLLAQSKSDSLRKEYHILVEEQRDKEAETRNTQFYDSLAHKAKNRKVTHLLHGLLIKNLRSTPQNQEKVISESEYYRPFTGRKIASIKIDRLGVFNRDGSWIERAGNALHIETRERTIRRDLLLHVGDTINPDQLVRNMQLLRSRKYISDATLEVYPDSVDPRYVHVYIKTRDSWTITFDGRWGGGGETMVAISDDNIMGWGNRLEIETNFNRRDFSYGGTIVEYSMPNMWGSFIEGELSVGREFSESEFIAQLAKPLIEPTDYFFGISYNRVRKDFVSPQYPDISTTLERCFNLWGGYSHAVKGKPFNLYATTRYRHDRFRERPDVTPTYNPAYHNKEEFLVALGLYRELFYTANMIYGFGTREYIPAGYRAELIGGYNWGEFREDFYLGTHIYGGRFTPYGYFSADLAIGSYIDPDNGSWYQSMGDISLSWFSNLLHTPHTDIRQFVKLDYTHGWNRSAGYNESLVYTEEKGLRILDENFSGIQRLVLNTETVIFTPFQPWGFRFTCYGFADIGVIGHSNNLFRNNLYGAIGIGVRIRNERLVFGAIQLQLGIAFGKGGWAESEWIELSSQDSFSQPRYLPSRPETLVFE